MSSEAPKAETTALEGALASLERSLRAPDALAAKISLKKLATTVHAIAVEADNQAGQQRLYDLAVRLQEEGFDAESLKKVFGYVERYYVKPDMKWI